MIKHGCLAGASLKRRVPKEFLGAFKAGHRHHSREFIDDDFSFQLLSKAEAGDGNAREALEWLTKFNNEHYKAVIKRDGTDFYEDQPDPERARLDLYNLQYARRMDAMTKRSSGERDGELTEDDVNSLIDFKRDLEGSIKN